MYESTITTQRIGTAIANAGPVRTGAPLSNPITRTASGRAMPIEMNQRTVAFVSVRGSPSRFTTRIPSNLFPIE